VPTAGNALLAPVHAGTYDVIHAHMGHGRPHRIMAVDWLWKIPGAGPLLDRGGAFAVSPGNPASSLRVAEGVLADGQSLLVYPSGNIPMVAPIQPAKRGAALLAIRTGTPVVPAGEFGTSTPAAYGSSWLRRLLTGERPQAAIAFGEPIPTHHLDPSNPRDVIALTAEIERRQRALSEVARAHVEAAR
jgi:1-acyl-sn-glycerol-3-phosphate acyltransferase